MAISQILKGQLTFWAQQFERYNRYKASSGNPLKYGWGILNLIFRCQCHLRHQPKIVQWHPISLLLKRSGYIHLLLEQCFKSGDVIDMCEWRRILDFCRRGLFNDKITSEMYFLCQSYWEKIFHTIFCGKCLKRYGLTTQIHTFISL